MNRVIQATNAPASKYFEALADNCESEIETVANKPDSTQRIIADCFLGIPDLINL